MKHVVSTMAVAITLLTFSVSLHAQTSTKQRMSREQLAETQARHIANTLALDDATAQKYIAAYCQYQQEIWALGPRVQSKKQTDMTEAESEQAIKERFEHSQKILKIREKYYKEYSKFMTQKQIRRAYELEQQMMHRLTRHHRGGQQKGNGPQRRTRQNR
ncbi:MAG: hypothetical protein IJM81_03905 [Prevotella sp.]|nr:hypothetical protein [Prevotella sp.]